MMISPVSSVRSTGIVRFRSIIDRRKSTFRTRLTIGVHGIDKFTGGISPDLHALALLLRKVFDQRVGVKQEYADDHYRQQQESDNATTADVIYIPDQFETGYESLDVMRKW